MWEEVKIPGFDLTRCYVSGRKSRFQVLTSLQMLRCYLGRRGFLGSGGGLFATFGKMIDPLVVKDSFSRGSPIFSQKVAKRPPCLGSSGLEPVRGLLRRFLFVGGPVEKAKQSLEAAGLDLKICLRFLEARHRPHSKKAPRKRWYYVCIYIYIFIYIYINVYAYVCICTFVCMIRCWYVNDCWSSRGSIIGNMSMFVGLLVCLLGWSVGPFGQLVGWWSVGQLVGWSVGWSVGRSVGRLVVYVVASFF